MNDPANEDIWSLIPDVPKCDEIVGHPEWMFEDPACTEYSMRVPDYPVEKLRTTVGNIEYTAYHESCAFSAYWGDMMPVPFIRYLMGVPVPQLAEEFREFVDFAEGRPFYLNLHWGDWYGAFITLLGIDEISTNSKLWGWMEVGWNFINNSYRHGPVSIDRLPFYGADQALEAIQAQHCGEPDRASELMYDYVDRLWYDEHSEHSWHGKFEKFSGFIGYWCFEIAAINQIHGINDERLFDHPYYPSDLVEYYRDTVTNDRYERTENDRIRRTN